MADIHFDYRLALAAISAGADKIRINPGNIGGKEKVRRVADAAKAAGIPIRVGVNSGSLEKDILEKNGGPTAVGLVESALRNVELLEDLNFHDIVISLKSSDVKMNYDAYRMLAAKTDYPLHIGVTEAGTLSRGKVKSAAGIGALLLAGIGDTMRVSLTADPVEEVLFAKELLKATGIRESGFDLVSCPTCGRTKVDLEAITLGSSERLPPARAGGGTKMESCGYGMRGQWTGRSKGRGFGRGLRGRKGVLFARGEILKTVRGRGNREELIRS